MTWQCAATFVVASYCVKLRTLDFATVPAQRYHVGKFYFRDQPPAWPRPPTKTPILLTFSYSTLYMYLDYSDSLSLRSDIGLWAHTQAHHALVQHLGLPRLRCVGAMLRMERGQELLHARERHAAVDHMRPWRTQSRHRSCINCGPDVRALRAANRSAADTKMVDCAFGTWPTRAQHVRRRR